METVNSQLRVYTVETEYCRLLLWNEILIFIPVSTGAKIAQETQELRSKTGSKMSAIFVTF